MIQTELDFLKWIDNQLDVDIPCDITAFHLNLTESPFTIELIGESSFSVDDDDWACEENWVPELRAIEVSQAIYGSAWDDAQDNILAMVKLYLSSNYKNSQKLNNAQCFVDGNLVFVK